MEPNLYQLVGQVFEKMNENHLEVVQRLSVLETELKELKALPPRVTDLENERARISGGWAVGTVVLNVLITVFGFLFRRHA